MRPVPIPAVATLAFLFLAGGSAAAQQEAPLEDFEALEAPAPRPGMPGALAGPTVLDRLEQMTPEQRRNLLDKLPPERRKRLERRLAAYEALPAAERERLRRQYDRFRALTPQQKQTARRLFREFLTLPPGRRQALRQESVRLSRMPWPARKARMASPEFERRYSAEERQILHALAVITPNP